MFDLKDVLQREGIAASDVNVMLHSPNEGDLQTMMPSLVRTRPKAIQTYQAAHSKEAEKTLSQGRPWVASFVKTGVGNAKGTSAMLFAGLFENHGATKRARTDIAADPEIQWLKKTFSYFSQLDADDWTHWTWFDLKLHARLQDLRGRLVIKARLTPNYVRLAENLQAPVLALHQKSSFGSAPPPWREMRPSAGMLRTLPASWVQKLRDWRGIYLIVDESNGARYVGSAAWADNFYGRWCAHVAGDHGATAGFVSCRPKNFRFSILERMSPDATVGEVSRREQTWMERLHAFEFGLNRKTYTEGVETGVGMAGHVPLNGELS